MIDIRLADPAAPELSQLLIAPNCLCAAETPDATDPAHDPQILRDQGLQFWAAYHEERAVACGALQTLDDDAAEIKSVYVAADMRGRGLARQVMQHLSEEAAAAGIGTLSLELGASDCPNHGTARRLYEALGYRETASCDPEVGAGIRMTKHLRLRRAA